MSFSSRYLQLSPLIKITLKGNSMFPVCKTGETVIVNKIIYWFGDPKINDIVILKSPRENRWLIKRIAKEKDGKYFVIGENEDESTDSRHFGWIERKNIIGKVINGSKKK